MPRAVERIGKNVIVTDSDESSEEFTDETLVEMRKELSKSLQPTEVDKIVNIFSKFTKGSTPEQSLEGVVSEKFSNNLWK